MELIIISIALVLGIIWGLYLKISIAFFLPCVFAIVLFVKKEYKKYLILFFTFLVISNIYISIKENDFNNKYKNINGSVDIIGTIVTEPKKEKNRTKFIVKVETIEKDSKYKNTKILVSLNTKNNNLKFGNKIKIYSELENPSSARNEGGFNYQEYLKTKEIYKIVFAKNNQVEVMEEDNIGLIDNCLYLIRNSIKDSAKKILPEKEANFLIAILIGDKQELDEDIQNNFRNSSLSHVLAVSGMHVSYIILGLSLILNKIKISKTYTKVFLILFLIFFILLTGCSPSVERACIMSIYLIVGTLIHRKTNTLNSIAFSNIILLLINPYNIKDLGYVLSFGGTLGIVLIFPKIKKNLNKKINIKYKTLEKIIDVMLVTLSANLVLFPIILLYFNTISTTFLLSNLLVSCIIGIILIFGFIIIILTYICYPIAKLLSIIEKILIDILLKTAEIVGNIPFSQIYFITPKFYIIILYYLILFLFVYGSRKETSKNKKNNFSNFNFNYFIQFYFRKNNSKRFKNLFYRCWSAGIAL